VPPVPLKVISATFKVIPFVVIVFAVVAIKSIWAEVHEVAEVTEKFPATLIDAVPENVTIPADTVISRHDNAPVIVTVYVVAWSKKILSDVVGTDAPDAPPDEADQCVVDVVSQVPEPPTQYRFAMFTPQG
jgi:hypothetical protein